MRGSVPLLAEVLIGLSVVTDPAKRDVLRYYIDEWCFEDLTGDARIAASRLAAAALREKRVAHLFRALGFLEGYGRSWTRGRARVEPLIRAEEGEFLLTMADRTREEEAALLVDRLREALTGEHPVERPWGYGGATGTGSPVPVVDLWELFLDLSDLPVRGGRIPLAEFVEKGAGDLGERAVELLRRWLALCGLASPEPEEGFAADAVRVRTTGPVPARLLVRIAHDRGGRYRLEWWAVLSRSVDAEPEIGPRHIHPRPVGAEEFGAVVHGLFVHLDNRSERGNHDRVRIELVVPLRMLAELDAPQWESRVEPGGEPVRLGARAEVVYRVEEFCAGDSEDYLSARVQARRKWHELLRTGASLIFDVESDHLPHGVNVPEYLSGDDHVFFSAGHYERERWFRTMSSAVLSGVPVIAWRRGDRDVGDFRSVLVRGEGTTVTLDVIGALPHRLHRQRRGRPPEPGEKPIPDCYNVGLVYHDDLPHPLEPFIPLFPDSPWRPDESGGIAS